MKAAQQIKILESYKGKEESLPKIEIGKLLQISLIVYGAIEKHPKGLGTGKWRKWRRWFLIGKSIVIQMVQAGIVVDEIDGE